MRREGRVGFSDPATAGMFNDVSPFFFSALPDGTIGLVGSASQLKTTVDAAHARGINVLAVDHRWQRQVGDGDGDPRQHHQPYAARAEHRRPRVSSGFDGIDLDYEGFAFSDGSASWPSTQPVWVAFVTELASALHAKGKLLSVTIPPTWMDARRRPRVSRVRPTADRQRWPTVSS